MGGSSLSMALFLSLWDSRHACMDDWVERQRIAEVDRDRLTRAAVTIQPIRRGCVRRRQVREMRTACIVLQRIWRGFISREVATYDSIEQHLTANFKKSKHCAKHLRRALGAQLYSQTYKKAAQNAGLATEGGTYQHASMPRPLDNSYTLGLRPLPE